jgi:hypothetical protein
VPFVCADAAAMMTEEWDGKEGDAESDGKEVVEGQGGCCGDERGLASWRLCWSQRAAMVVRPSCGWPAGSPPCGQRWYMAQDLVSVGSGCQLEVTVCKFLHKTNVQSPRSCMAVE